MKQFVHIHLVFVIFAWTPLVAWQWGMARIFDHESKNPDIRTSDIACHDMEDLFLQEQPEIRKFATAIPFDVGIKYNIREQRSYGAALVDLMAFNDNADNIANKYPKRSAYLTVYTALERSWREFVAHPEIEKIVVYKGSGVETVDPKVSI